MDETSAPVPTGPRETGADAAPVPQRRAPRFRVSNATRRALLTVLILSALAGLFFVGRFAQTGTESTAAALPDSVERVAPPSGSEVLRQASVEIIVAPGHDAVLQINGVRIETAEDGLIKDLGSGLIRYQPAPGLPIESLESGSNTVVAEVWDQTQGRGSAQTVVWSFEAT